MLKMKLIQRNDGYKEIIYVADEFGQPKEKPLKCVMCDNFAFFIAMETNEPLCSKCKNNNDEARRRK